MSISRRLLKLEACLPRAHSYVVEIAAGETADEAIGRAAQRRPFFFIPAPIASMDEWARHAAEGFSP